jgi:hypothetical protein
MRVAWTAVLLLAAGAVDPMPNPRYFQRVRDLQVHSADRQNYFVVDPALWAHARSDLGDLRIYRGDLQIPYALAAQDSASASEQHKAKILNLGKAHGETEFDLDMKGLAEYDRVQLRLSATNFVATAFVDGREKLGDSAGTRLKTSTLYDFSRERLGSSFVLSIPASTFRYLHVRISGDLEPQQVLGAEISFLRESKAAWVSAGTCGAPEQRQRETVVTCTLQPSAPVARVAFDVAPNLLNFRRTVTVATGKGGDLTRGSINRIRIERARPPVIAEDLAVQVPCTCDPEQTSLRITIDNGDDPPLVYARVEPQALERRGYFDPQGQSGLRLYYGDAKLDPPVYDYAKFFKQADDAALAQLGPEAPNPAYTGRPDLRPWSERHPAVLWIVMLVVVALLGGVAIRAIIIATSAKSG